MKHLNTILITIVIILSTALLVGNRFGFKWTGGDGFEKHQIAILPTFDEPYATFKRGETISTINPPDDAEGNYKYIPLYVKFGSAEIWLDENTEIKLIDGREDKLEINVIQGRVLISGNITVSTREVRTYINGTTSFVHYSWLDEIEVASLDGKSIINVPDQEQMTLNKQAVKMTTLPNYSFEYFDFVPETSSAANFYKSSITIND